VVKVATFIVTLILFPLAFLPIDKLSRESEESFNGKESEK